MSRELEHLLQVGSLEFGAWWLQLGNKLKPEGKKHHWNLFHLIATGQKTSLDQHIQILSGYDYTSQINGLENLGALRGQNILLLGNHSHLGPIEGYGETILTSYYVKKYTDEEVRWIRGRGKSLKENARQLVDKSIGTIPIYDDRIMSLKAILEAFRDNETVGLYPEGENSITLKPGNPTAGKLVMIAIEKDIPVILASTHFQDNTFFANFAPLFDEEKNKQIQNIFKKLTRQEENEMKGNLVNYTMARIARHLPEHKRGYYRNFQDVISRFEELTTQ